ncbi:hypothetical protein HSBAA_36020 [Vreelandella sulfidaeris]|uniref:7-carboxy-7-deazaguanine synthase n=1 Tax=Vreelandella sulfidaeris TaxID=115553 RepID=A0A455U840_9GAMM|nr:hypothetical protein HSBAA_36020 [Halomonas sulfidaeris]
MYQVKEAFYTLQGEGAQAGRASVFCRFSGCNLWSGREIDRATAKCTFAIPTLSVQTVSMAESLSLPMRLPSI